MRLLEAILEANHRTPAAGAKAGLHPTEFNDSLPLVALTCIDPRLNPLIPQVLGVPEEQLIWLRNAGNIIFDTMSSMMRTLALGCAIKKGKEIAVIGHSDCQVGKATTLQITDGFRLLGVDRSLLPENLNEFFGLFASERQNVIRGADIIRQSRLIGPRVPVHGLLLDLETGRLEWLVNGYQTLDVAVSSLASASAEPEKLATDALSGPLSAFNLGEMKFPDLKIGETAIDPNPWKSQLMAPNSPDTIAPGPEKVRASGMDPSRRFDPSRKYKIIGSDEKVYGPITGLTVLEWIADGRISWDTASQMEGSMEWRPLRAWGDAPSPPPVPAPPAIKPVTRPPTSKRR